MPSIARKPSHELSRIRLLLEVYEVALREIRLLGDPASDELRLGWRHAASAAAYDYYERLQAEATLSPADSWPLRRSSA